MVVNTLPVNGEALLRADEKNTRFPQADAENALHRALGEVFSAVTGVVLTPGLQRNLDTLIHAHNSREKLPQHERDVVARAITLAVEAVPASERGGVARYVYECTPESPLKQAMAERMDKEAPATGAAMSPEEFIDRMSLG